MNIVWWAQIIIYLIACLISFFALWQIDFNKFMRVNKKEMSIIVYVILSLALGFLLGKLFIEISSLIQGR